MGAVWSLFEKKAPRKARLPEHKRGDFNVSQYPGHSVFFEQLDERNPRSNPRAVRSAIIDPVIANRSLNPRCSQTALLMPIEDDPRPTVAAERVDRRQYAAEAERLAKIRRREMRHVDPECRPPSSVVMSPAGSSTPDSCRPSLDSFTDGEIEEVLELLEMRRAEGPDYAYPGHAIRSNPTDTTEEPPCQTTCQSALPSGRFVIRHGKVIKLGCANRSPSDDGSTPK